MPPFASRENSPAEERAILAEIISTFDAVELKPPGIERARQLADQSESLGAGEGQGYGSADPAKAEGTILHRPDLPAPENLPLWEEAA